MTISPLLHSRKLHTVPYQFSSVDICVWLFRTQWKKQNRLPCPSPTPGVCSNSCPLSWWCHPTILSSVAPFSSCPQSFPESGPFPMSWLCIRWPKYCSFSISLSDEYSGFISFRIDWFDLLTVQGTLKSLLQHHSLKASILRCSVFFMVQLSHPYMTTRKTIAWIIWTFVDKVMSLLLTYCLVLS